MFEKEAEISILISLYQKNEINAQQTSLLFDWLERDSANQRLFDELNNPDKLQAKFANYSRINEERGWTRVIQEIKESTAVNRPVRRISLWPKIIGVAAAIAFLAICVYLFQYRHNKDGANIYVNDIKPGKPGATLTLSNGTKIRLEDAANGVLASQAGITIRKSPEGELIYETKESAGDKSDLNAMNTLSTARGETYRVRLPDGSLVWLNAASSLSYTLKLNVHGKRLVKLDGEGYFEVAKNKAMPFIVETSKQIVRVLGTHFNINSYKNEKNTKTTLLEGSVQISGGSESSLNRILKPGEEAVLHGNSLTVDLADTEQTLAWKNGYFRFQDEPIQSVMQKLARWYDIDVFFEGKASTENFNGKISRSNNISVVLNALETTKAIHFKVEGRRVTVMQ